MAFNPNTHWTATGVTARQLYMAAQIPPIAGNEVGDFTSALNQALIVWAQMTMSVYQPPNPVPGSAAVNYTYNGNPRSRNVNWQVNTRHWNPAVGVTLDVFHVW